MSDGHDGQVSLDGFTYEVRLVSEGMAEIRMSERVLGTHSGGFIVAPTAHVEAMLAGLAAAQGRAAETAAESA